MRLPRTAFAAALIITLLPVQFAIVNRLPLPGTAPDLPILAVAAVGLVWGPDAGLVMGFCTGLTADLIPPADHTLGRLALAYALAGFVAGLLSTEAERSAFAPIAVVALAALVAEGTFAFVGALLGDARITADSLARNVPSSVLYDVLLTPFLVPLLMAASRRLEPDPSRR